MKDINNELSRLIEKKGGSYFSAKHTKIFEEKPIELQIKTLTKEIKNTAIMLKVKHNECQKLRRRLKLVSQPNFRFSMKQELVDLQE